jgi:ADP-ribosylglycohydrolase
MGSLYLETNATGAPLAYPATFMRGRANEHNSASQANGALMRCSPIPAWYWDQPYNVIAEIARQDAQLSHPNSVCQDCNAVYAVAIAYLVKEAATHGGGGPDCLQTVRGLAREFGVCSKVLGWMDAVTASGPTSNIGAAFNCQSHVGHVKHAFQLAFYHLARQTPFEEAMVHTLMQGGDTDTNAAIVGGLMGGLHGASAIPQYMSGPVFDFDCSQHSPTISLCGYQRPDAYRASNVLRTLGVCEYA